MRGLRLDLIATIGTAGLQVWLVSSGTGGVPGVATGLVFTLVLPGYAVLAALRIPQRHRLSPAQHLALSIPLSIAVVAVVGLVLNEVGLGIDAVLQASVLALLTCASAGVAMLSRSGPSFEPTLRAAAIAAGIAISALCIGVLAGYIDGQPPSDSVSLYVVGSDGSVETIPTEVAPGGVVTLTLGVDYSGPGQAAFTLEAPGGSWDVQLRDGQTWQRNVSVVLPRPGLNDLVFRLVGTGPTQTERSVTVRVLVR
jgi:uncharacterized membrane protein